MRLALIIGQLSIGGAEGQLAELVRRLDRHRFEPVVYSLIDSPGGVRPALEAAGVPTRAVGAVGLARARRLARMLVHDGIELAHAWLFIANSYAWAARRLGARIPLVTSARNCKSQGWLHRGANIAAFRASERIVVNSEQVREYIVARYGAPRRSASVVYNGVDTERFRPSPRPASAPPTVITAGRFVAQKNPWLFVDAAARVARELPAVRFVMAGDGPLRPAVEAHARALGLGARIEFSGERRDMERLLAGADVLWLTSSWEGLPNVILEAMACGLPVVATDVGGTRELFRSGREGFLVRPNQADELAHYGLALLRDPGLRARMGAAARQRAHQFELSRMVAGMEAVYASALAAAAASAAGAGPRAGGPPAG